MRKFLDAIQIMLALAAGTAFVGGFVLLMLTEIANELKARTRQDELNEEKRRAKQKPPVPSPRP